MKGLVRLLELVGDQDKLDARTINTIRKYESPQNLNETAPRGCQADRSKEQI